MGALLEELRRAENREIEELRRAENREALEAHRRAENREEVNIENDGARPENRDERWTAEELDEKTAGELDEWTAEAFPVSAADVPGQLPDQELDEWTAEELVLIRRGRAEALRREEEGWYDMHEIAEITPNSDLRIREVPANDGAVPERRRGPDGNDQP